MPECRDCERELTVEEGTVICGITGPLWRLCTDCYPDGAGGGAFEEPDTRTGLL